MSEETHKAIMEAVKEAVTINVNGKIDKLTDIMNNHTKVDEDNARILNQYIKDDMKWKEEADPYIKLAVNISGVWKFLIYIVVGLLSLIGFYNIVQK